MRTRFLSRWISSSRIRISSLILSCFSFCSDLSLFGRIFVAKGNRIFLIGAEIGRFLCVKISFSLRFVLAGMVSEMIWRPMELFGLAAMIGIEVVSRSFESKRISKSDPFSPNLMKSPEFKRQTPFRIRRSPTKLPDDEFRSFRKKHRCSSTNSKSACWASTWGFWKHFHWKKNKRRTKREDVFTLMTMSQFSRPTVVTFGPSGKAWEPSRL